MIQHNCGHGTFFRRRWTNDWLGRAIGVVTLTPYDHWRRSHAIHHASSGNLKRRGIGDIELPANASQQPGALGTFRVWLAVNPGVSMSVTFGFPSRWSVWEVAAHPLGSASALI